MNRVTHISRRPLVAALGLAFSAAARAATVSVDSNDDSVAPAGCNLRQAIASINAGAATTACAGAVTGTFGSNDTIVFSAALIGSTVTLAQGLLSTTVPMTIAGSGQTIDAHGAAYGVLSSSASLSLSNLTLTGGNAVTGGGLYARGAGSVVKLSNVAVRGNAASGNGGGIRVSGAAMTLDHSVVTANTSSDHAAGIDASGGASLTLNNSRVTANSALGNCGGILISNSSGSLANSTVSGNSVSCNHSYCSGGLYAYASSVTVAGSTISGNIATGGTSTDYVTGGFYMWQSNVAVTNSTVSGNQAIGNEFLAGAFSESNPTTGSFGLKLTNTTVSNNFASTSPGAGNANFITGGLLVGFYVAGDASAANTIISGNGIVNGTNPPAASDAVVSATSAPTVSIRFSVLGTASSGAFAGNGNVFSDAPGLGVLKNNGGQTQTMALLAGSPALDAGSNALALDANSQPLSADQTGAARIVNATVDIGAFEFPGDHIFGNGFEP